MKRITTIFTVLFIVSPLVLFAQENIMKSGISKNFNIEVNVDYQFIIHLPKNQPPGRLLPLIIFLHGTGERGDSLELVRIHGPWNYAEAHEDFPFMILAPQCREGETWDPVTLDLLLDDVILNYPVDTNRIYLTGLSRGGFGVWDWVQYRPRRFAAIAPICGASNYHVLNANILKDTPTWIFHGALDDVIPVGFSVNLVKRLRSLGAEVSFTVYPYSGHDSWTETYMNDELYSWFLTHSKKLK